MCAADTREETDENNRIFTPFSSTFTYWAKNHSFERQNDGRHMSTVEIVIMHIAGSLGAMHFWDGGNACGGGRPLKCPCTMLYVLSID